MKMRTYRMKFDVLILLMLLGTALSAQETNKIVRSVECGGCNTFELYNRTANVEFIEWDKSEIKVETIIRELKGRSDEDEALVMRAIKECKPEKVGSVIKLNTIFWNEWTQRNSKIKITLTDGSVARLSELKVEHIIYFPKNLNLKIINRYSTVQLPDVGGDLAMELYSSKLYCGQVDGKYSLEGKYSKVECGNVQAIKAKLYDCDIAFADCAGNVEIGAKYSKIEGNSCQDIDIDSYDDVFRINNLGNIRGKMKYTEMEGESCGNIRFNLYDCDLKFTKAAEIDIISKYSSFRFGYCTDVLFESYDDDFQANEANSLNVRDKYSEWKFDRLNKSLKAESYSSSFDIELMSNGFEFIEIDGKYGSANIDFAKDAAYSIDAKLKYGKLDYPDKEFANTHIERGSSDQRIQAKTKNCGESCSKILIDTYSMSFRLRNLR